MKLSNSLKLIIFVLILILLSSCITIQKTVVENQTPQKLMEETKLNNTEMPQSIQNITPTIEKQDYIMKGDFEDRARSVIGTAYIVNDKGNRFLKLSKDFETTRTNNLKVLLAKRGRIFTGEDLYKGGYYNLGELKNFEGEQYYEISEDVDMREYQSVAIHSFADNLVSGNARLLP